MNVVPAAPPLPPGRPARPRGSVLLLALLALCGLLVAACSSGSSSDPSPQSGASAPAAGASSGSSQSGEVAFAQCVRAHGVPQMPDPQNGHFIMSSGVQDNPDFQSALRACQHLLGAGGIGTGSNTSAMLSFAHCMQTHGVPQFPDPSANGALDIPPSVDRNSRQFQQADQECKADLSGSQGPRS